MITRKLVLAIGMGTLLFAGAAHAAVLPADVCKDKKLKATGTKTKSIAKAFGKNIKVPNVGKLTSDISKAQSKFTKAFTKAEFTGSGVSKGCLTIEDADAIEAKVDALVLESIVLLESGLSTAKVITDVGDCVEGPLSRCRVGDFLIENGEIRVVIQEAQRNLFAIGQFGGQIIDADLRRVPGDPERDNFEEWSTSINIENTAHYTDVDVINDGSDGEAAVIRATGPDDLLDFLNPSSVVASFGFVFPPAANETDLPISVSTDYILEPGKNYVRVETTIQNESLAQVDFFFGEFLNGSGQIDLWQPGYSFGETLVTNACPGAAANPCNAIIYKGVDEAAGVSYGYVHNVTATTAFTASGVTVPLLGRSIAAVFLGSQTANFSVEPMGDPGDSVTFTRYFVVGDGTVSSILEARNEIQGIATGTLQGTVDTPSGGPAPGAHVAVIGLSAQGPPGLSRNIVNHTDTDEDGNYSLTLPAGSYNVVVNISGHPYEGGGSSPMQHPVVIVAGATTTQDVTMPDTGTLLVSASDGVGDIPAKVSVVGFDPSPPQINTQSLLAGAINNSTSTFAEAFQDGVPFGVAKVLFIEPDGSSGVVPIEPASYQVVVSRGPEYTIDSDPITVTANNQSSVSATIARVIDTTGFVSGDFHVHSIQSADSEVTERERIVTMMSEGLEFYTPSDHENRRSVQPIIVSEGWQDLVTTATGNEMTAFDYGHFNSWPMTIDTNQVNGGAVDHGGAAPDGQDFPSFGNYNLTPEEIIAAAKLDPGTEVVQINHISSHFGLDVGGTDLGSGLAIDTGLEPPKSVVPPAARRLDPAEEDLTQGYFTDTFDALEIWIGASRGQITENFLGQNAGDWFNLLNQGIVRTGVSDSDTHQRISTQSGTPRTMIASSESDLTMLNPETLASTIISGRAMGTNGPMVRLTVEALTSGDDATLEDGDTNLVTATDGEVNVHLEIQSPTWAEFDTIELYLNSETFQTINQDQETGAGMVDVPRYQISPDYVLGTAAVPVKDKQFTVTTESVPGGSRLEAVADFTFDGTDAPALTEDTWIVVMVKGSDGISKPLFPMVPNSISTRQCSVSGAGCSVDGDCPPLQTCQPVDTLAELTDGNLDQSGILALSFTNPIFVDFDGNLAYDAPGVRCVTESGPHPNCVTTTTSTTTTTNTTTTTL